MWASRCDHYRSRQRLHEQLVNMQPLSYFQHPAEKHLKSCLISPPDIFHHHSFHDSWDKKLQGDWVLHPCPPPTPTHTHTVNITILDIVMNRLRSDSLWVLSAFIDMVFLLSMWCIWISVTRGIDGECSMLDRWFCRGPGCFFSICHHSVLSAVTFYSDLKPLRPLDLLKLHFAPSLFSFPIWDKYNLNLTKLINIFKLHSNRMQTRCKFF